jgi:putative methionine-R-sulfoxide reductase with GAF domain
LTPLVYSTATVASTDLPILQELRRCLTLPEDRGRLATRAAEVIRNSRGYRWVGLYDVGEQDISVVGWSGPAPPTYPAFPRAAGLNGVAVATGKAVIVQDVAEDPRYLSTLGNTRAEMIVPVRVAGRGVVGTIDVESERENAFGPADGEWLEACAGALTPLWSQPQ